MAAATPITVMLSQLVVDVALSSPQNNDVLTYETASSKWKNKPLTVPVGANPSALVGLSAVNGSAGTFLRSDGAPALSQAIVPTWTGLHTFSATAVANTSFDGIVLVNPTAATSGNQSFGPRLRMTAQGWKTTSVAGSQTVDWTLENRPVQGTASPSSNLVFSSQINGSGYADVLTLASGGLLALGSPSATNTGLAIQASDNGGSSGLTVQPQNLTQWLNVGWAGITSSGPIILTPSASVNIGTVWNFNTTSGGGGGVNHVFQGVGDATWTVAAGNASNPGLAISGFTSQSAPLAQLQGVSSTATVRPQADIDTAWSDATDATRSADLILRAWYTTSAQEVIRIGGRSGGGVLGFYGVSPVARQVLATGVGATADQIITALQNLGLLSQT